MPLTDKQKRLMQMGGYSDDEIAGVEQQVAQGDQFAGFNNQVMLQGSKGLADILNAQGLTPQQRAMMSATMSRSLGAQAEQGGLGLGRRAAAQGISGTGLANAGLGQIQSGLLSAMQQGEEGINQQSIDLYRSALQSALGITEAEKNRKFQENQQEKQKPNVFGTLAGLVGGPLGELVVDQIFGKKKAYGD